jgi:alpha-methylacyl-CoA racemase
MTTNHRSGPLSDLRIVEFAGLGPAPFACMLLSDMGAEVVTIDRPGKAPDASQVVMRGRRLVQADLKDPAVRDDILALLESADVLVEGFRPGVMERLGLGPDVVAARNPRLVYARMTGWGQEGPLAQAAGHDINYIAITGALHAIGPAEHPVPPLNLVGDYGGGSLYLVAGILAALHHAKRTGQGQVVDAAITDGTLSLMTPAAGWALRGGFVEERQKNMLDGGAPYYRTYETSDHLHVSLGAIEPQFFAAFCERVGLPAAWRAAQNDTARWPELHEKLEAIFRSQTQQHWIALLEGTDCCFAPVLPLSAAARHPHNVARQAFVEVEGVMQPAPAPRFSQTPSRVQGAPPRAATGLQELVSTWQQQRP